MSYLTVSGGVRLRYTDRDPAAGAGPGAGATAGPGAGATAGPVAGATAGRPVVLVHGWKGSHRLWDPVTARLRHDRRVVAFDLRGMGESDKPDCAYDFDELSDDLGAVIDTLQVDDAILVGWSMGTTVALRYLERGGAGAGALVIVNGPLRLTRAPDFPHAMTDAELEAHLMHLRNTWPAGERAFQADTVLEPAGPLVDWLYGIALQTPLDVALRLVEHQSRLDMRPALTAFDLPVVAAYSRHDPYYPPSLAHYIAEHAKNGRAAIFERSRHCIPIEEPDRFCALIRELDQEQGR